MAGAIFVETLRRSWRQIVYWGLGIGLLGLYVTVIIKDVDFLKQYAQIAQSMPPALLQMFGIEDTATLATPDGFITFAFFGYTLLILAVFTVIAGLNVTANEEDEGIMDVLLSLPVARWRVVLEKFAAFTIIALGIVMIGFLGMWVGLQTSALEVSRIRLVESTVNMMPGILLMLAFTMFMATVVRRKSTATALAAIFIIASYVVDLLGSMASGTLADTLRAASFFHYYDAAEVMKSGLNLGNVLLLLGATVVLVVGSLLAYNRRDVGV